MNVTSRLLAFGAVEAGPRLPVSVWLHAVRSRSEPVAGLSAKASPSVTSPREQEYLCQLVLRPARRVILLKLSFERAGIFAQDPPGVGQDRRAIVGRSMLHRKG